MKSPQSKGAAPDSLARRIVPAALVTIMVGGLAALLWLKLPKPEAAVASAATSPPPDPADTPATPAAAANFEPILGNWLREDGGYRLHLKTAGSDGRLSAEYYNPRPINVSFVSATNATGAWKVRVELNDVGYPGCVYSLVHDRVNDRLIGTYFQAALRETFEVMFVRVP